MFLMDVLNHHGHSYVFPWHCNMYKLQNENPVSLVNLLMHWRYVTTFQTICRIWVSFVKRNRNPRLSLNLISQVKKAINILIFCIFKNIQ